MSLQIYHRIPKKLKNKLLHIGNFSYTYNAPDRITITAKDNSTDSELIKKLKRSQWVDEENYHKLMEKSGYGLIEYIEKKFKAENGIILLEKPEISIRRKYAKKGLYQIKENRLYYVRLNVLLEGEYLKEK